MSCEYWRQAENGYCHCHQPAWQAHKYGCYFLDGGQENCPDFKKESEGKDNE